MHRVYDDSLVLQTCVVIYVYLNQNGRILHESCIDIGNYTCGYLSFKTR